ncbi:MAG: hypothetical protein IKU47_07325 [Oscillospiraceae bacterium]|nr:hypothetical protein [Oscillospiraceae bacterium]
MNETLRIEEIMKMLKVSKSFVRTHFQTVDLDWKLCKFQGKQNRDVCFCNSKKLMEYIADNIDVYYYDRSDNEFNAKKRPKPILIETPEELKIPIISGEFEFLNIEDAMQKLDFSSRESVYQFIYKRGLYLVKFFDKTYFGLIY